MSHCQKHGCDRVRGGDCDYPNCSDNGDLPDGWLTIEEGDALADLARGKVVLEIGAYLGRSTVAMARTAQLVVSVDHHRGSPEHQPGQQYYQKETRDVFDYGKVDTAEMFLRNLTIHGVRDKVIPVIGNIRDVKEFLNRNFDLVFLDGSHDHDAVVSDLKTGMTMTGKAIVVHDADVPSVSLAVQRVAGANGLVVRPLVGSLVVLT